MLKRLAILLFLSFIMVNCQKQIKPSKLPKYNTITYQVFPVDSGWGFDILVNNKVFIHQTRIPSVQGKFVFIRPEHARKTAILMIQKMLERPGLPYVSVEELDSLGVLYDTVKKLQEFVKSKMDPNYEEYIAKRKHRQAAHRK